MFGASILHCSHRTISDINQVQIIKSEEQVRGPKDDILVGTANGSGL
jgi:hypothetical protein